MVIKTYRRDESGVLYFREAWKDGSLLIINEGKVGSKGKRSHRGTRGRALYRQELPTMPQRIKEFRAETAASGYLEASDDALGWVVLQCWTHSHDLSHRDDARLFDQGQDALNEYLGVRGVGHLDGYDIGGKAPAEYELDGTVLNLFCRAIDTGLGVKVVRGFARDFGLSQMYIVASREPGADSPYVLAWSPRARDKKLGLPGL